MSLVIIFSLMESNFDVDIYAAKGQEGNWYVFTSRSRKYPNGARPDRSAGPGYWKATGSDQDILNAYGEVIGCKKALTYLVGKQPAGEKTGWLMQEYRIKESHRPVDTANRAMLWDDYVLCRIYCKDIPKDSNGKQNNPTDLSSQPNPTEPSPQPSHPYNEVLIYPRVLVDLDGWLVDPDLYSQPNPIEPSPQPSHPDNEVLIYPRDLVDLDGWLVDPDGWLI